MDDEKKHNLSVPDEMYREHPVLRGREDVVNLLNCEQQQKDPAHHVQSNYLSTFPSILQAAEVSGYDERQETASAQYRTSPVEACEFLLDGHMRGWLA